MLKYVNHDIVFQEYPDEVTLAINLSRCPNHCPGCHSAYLADDIGDALTAERLLALAGGYAAEITCVGFQGGDNDPFALLLLADALREVFPDIKVGWYSGRQELPEGFPVRKFDYVKLGPWLSACGPLGSPSTNQRFYRIDRTTGQMTDVTSRFWKK